MAKIRILAVPPGELPEWIRQEEVGLVLPTADLPPDATAMGVVSGNPINSESCYAVDLLVALNELDKKNPLAASWARHFIHPAVKWLSFPVEICQPC